VGNVAQKPEKVAQNQVCRADPAAGTAKGYLIAELSSAIKKTSEVMAVFITSGAI